MREYVLYMNEADMTMNEKIIYNQIIRWQKMSMEEKRKIVEWEEAHERGVQ